MRSKMYFRKLLLTSGIVCILGSSVLTFGAQSSKQITENQNVAIMDTYKYPVTPDDEKWGTLTLAEKIEVCRIPKDVCQSMSDEQLIQATLDSPCICMLYLYDTPEKGVEVLEKISDSYAELICRDTAKESLVKFIEKEACKKVKTSEQELFNDRLARLIAYQECFKDKLTIEDLEKISLVASTFTYIIAKEENDILDSSNRSSPIETPNHSYIYQYTSAKSCSHETSNFHETEAKSTADFHDIPEDNILDYGTCKYNCHSYAWYSQSPNNPYWIYNPSLYMTDGSYIRGIASLNANSLSVVLNDRIFYGIPNTSSLADGSSWHSGIIVDNPQSKALGNRLVKSKWGESGVFIHEAWNVPLEYDTVNVSTWHR